MQTSTSLRSPLHLHNTLPVSASVLSRQHLDILLVDGVSPKLGLIATCLVNHVPKLLSEGWDALIL